MKDDRLISLNAAIDEVKKYFRMIRLNPEILVDSLITLPPAQSEPKSYRMGYQAGYAAAQRWTPVSKKFPPEDEDVLLQFPSNQCVGYYADGDWMINTGDGIYSIVGDYEEKPIAWMPLPKEYRPEGDEHGKN